MMTALARSSKKQLQLQFFLVYYFVFFSGFCYLGIIRFFAQCWIRSSRNRLQLDLLRVLLFTANI